MKELDDLNSAVSELATGAAALATRQREFLAALDISVSNTLKALETYIHPDRCAEIFAFHAQVQKMGQSILTDADSLTKKVAPAHEMLVTLGKAIAASAVANG